MFIFKPQNRPHVAARLQIAYALLVAILAFLGCGDISKTGHMTDAASTGKIVVGYYQSSKRQYMSAVDLSKYTHINVAYAVVQADGSFRFEGDWFLPQVVSKAHSNNVKVLISLGGWTGSFAFSPLVASPRARANLISNIVTYLKTNNLHGVDIDWEYPGRQGDECNKVDFANDTPNFLQLLKDLRAGLDSAFGFGISRKSISLAVGSKPFDVNGGPFAEVSSISQYVDYINIMPYGIWSPAAGVTGPYAPLEGPGAGGIQAWLSAGFPASKINMGVPFHGLSAVALKDMSTSESMVMPCDSTVTPRGDMEDYPFQDPCAPGMGSVYSGVWQYKHLRDQGVIDANANAVGPWLRKFDEISKTPWLFSPNTKLFISYDDTVSLALKVKYARENGLAGMVVWAMHEDYKSELIDVILS